MAGTDLLPSWNHGSAKTTIVEFVRSVTEPGDAFVPAPGRIATFDNDGTLWCEKPACVQADFLFRRWRQMAEADPAKREEQPYKAVVGGDREWLAGILDHIPDLIKGVTEAYGGITTAEFEAAAREFFASASRPTLGVAYTDVAYKPMRELIALLKAHDFQVCICSGGGRDFVRAVSEAIYGVPRKRVIGAATTIEYRDGELFRTNGVEQPIDDGPGKASISGREQGAGPARRRQRRRGRADARNRPTRAPQPP